MLEWLIWKCIFKLNGGLRIWNTSRLLKLAIYVKALRTADAENARLHVSQLARLAAVSQISSAKILKQTNKANLIA